MTTDIYNPEQEFGMSPEMVEVVTSYLQTNDTAETAKSLNIPRQKVTYYLNKPEAKRFIDTVFLEQGYLNRSKMQTILDEIIEQKLEEMRESDMSSNKDIIDILAFAWKIRSDTAKETVEKAGPTTQTNVQINGPGFGGDNYNHLLNKLLEIK